MKNCINLIFILFLLAGLNALSQNEYKVKQRRNICAGVQNGVRIPNDNDCNSFTLCDQQSALTLRCRSSDPHFYRCNSTCVNDMTVCAIRDCPNSPTTTEQTTTTMSLPITTADPDEPSTTTGSDDGPTSTQSGPSIPTAPGDGTTTQTDTPPTPSTTTDKNHWIPTAPNEPTASKEPTTTSGGYTGIPTAPTAIY